MTSPITSTIEDYEKWSGKQLMRELQIELQIMDNRRVTGDPLEADEYLVTISRERYETLCRLALGRIEHLMRGF